MRRKFEFFSKTETFLISNWAFFDSIEYGVDGIPNSSNFKIFKTESQKIIFH